MTPGEFALEVLDIFSFDYCQCLFWRTDGEYAPLYISVDCSDVFEWGTADSEEITETDLPTLRQAKADAEALECGEYFPELYAARRRGIRPQGAFYRDGHLTLAMKVLFDAAGPPRESSLLNPIERS